MFDIDENDSIADAAPSNETGSNGNSIPNEEKRSWGCLRLSVLVLQLLLGRYHINLVKLALHSTTPKKRNSLQTANSINLPNSN